MDEVVDRVNDFSFLPDCHGHGAAIVFNHDLVVDCGQLLDDSLVHNFVAYLVSVVIIALADAECLSSCEECSW